MEKHDPILDEPEQLTVKQWYDHWAISYGPIVLIMVGVAMNILRWPFASFIIALGLLLTALRSSIYFFVRPRAAEDWFYFTVKMVLSVVLIFQFLFGRVGVVYIGLFVILYLIAVFLKLLKSHRKNTAENDKTEEDF